MPLDESTIENATASLSDESAISFYNCSLEEMINANDLGTGSVSTIIDLSGVWAATCQSGNDRMREILLSFLAPNAMLYTTYCPIINSWMRLIVNANATMEDFVDTNLTFGEGADYEKIFKIPIRRALEGAFVDEHKEFLQSLECAYTLDI
jgi:hypothetical protein